MSRSHNRYLTPFVPEPGGRIACTLCQVNRIIGRSRDVTRALARALGIMAENRHVALSAATPRSSSIDGNLRIIASGWRAFAPDDVRMLPLLVLTFAKRAARGNLD